jgi:ATP-binding cassette subfamily F protein uup
MATPSALVQAKGLHLSLGASPLFQDAEFVLHKGERLALIGANGAGKSTLMRMIAGKTDPDGGDIAIATGAVVAYAPQDDDFTGHATLRDYVCAPSSALGNASPAPAYTAEAWLAAYGLDPDRAPTGLSGGEQRRATLARAFAADADVLLLDEPTNHLDIAAIEDLEMRLGGFRGACLVISHDRRFLERVSTATLWLRQRRLLKLDRGFAQFEAWAEAVEEEDARALSRLETHLKAEERWLQRGVTARRSRNEGRRRRLMDMRAERRARKVDTAKATAQLDAQRGAESSRLVLELKHVSKSFGERRIISDLSLRVMRGDRIGIVGDNGAGKTTLLNLMLQRLAPDQGEVRLGDNLRIAYVDQARALMREDLTLWQTLCPQGGDQVIVNGKPRHVAAYARDFLFSEAQLRQPVKALSGGEQNRLSLAVALAQPANLLVLDEPTNDLDMDTLDALEDMLAAYEGTVVIVSHDRAFLDGVVTQIVGPIGSGRWAETPGGWSDFEREHRRAAPRTAPAPTKPEAAPSPRQKRNSKLSYKDERRLGELEDLMPRLSAEIEALEAQLSQTEAFAADAVSYTKAAQRLDAARGELEAAETEWLDLCLKRDALIEGA